MARILGSMFLAINCFTCTSASRVCSIFPHYYIEHARRCPDNHEDGETLGCDLFEHFKGTRFRNMKGDQQVHYDGSATLHSNNGFNGSKCHYMGRSRQTMMEKAHKEIKIPDYCSRAIVSELSTVFHAEMRPYNLLAATKVMFASTGDICLVPRLGGVVSNKHLLDWTLSTEPRPVACWNFVDDYRWVYCNRYKECACDDESDENCHRNAEKVQCCRDRYAAFNSSSQGALAAPARALAAFKILRQKPVNGDDRVKLRKVINALKEMELVGEAAGNYASELISYTKDSSASVREQAVRALANLDVADKKLIDTTVSALLESLAQDASTSVRRVAALSLTRYKDACAQHYSVLFEGLRMPVEHVHGTFDHHYAVEKLLMDLGKRLAPYAAGLSSYMSDTDERIRKVACQVLAKVGEEAAPYADKIALLLQDDSPRVVDGARDALLTMLRHEVTRSAAVASIVSALSQGVKGALPLKAAAERNARKLGSQ
eukprot:TRINITY_DN39881_c0_g1_i1.p1 TRINITY_DN39881_c0_g1~~TRINITY_DN39881_c0_g1_i1.p1  ORF type:complete len:488 (-),score=57.34 TRINITY_DN39881_c0_g1_i1:60-1523(-)